MSALRRALVASTVLAGVGLAPSVARALDRSEGDADEFAKLRERSPQAAELLERGEAQALAGAIEDAEATFKQAETAYPDASLPWRRDCQMLTILGRRAEAIHACNVATEDAHSLANLRASLRALVTGPEPPRSIDVFVALTLVENRRHQQPTAKSTFAAFDCDLAESVGDGTMLQECVSELETLAPNDPDTIRAAGLLARRCPPWRFWTGWGFIAVAVAATVVDAGARKRRRRAAKTLAAGVLVWAALAIHARPARAEDAVAPPKSSAALLSKWPVDDADPVASMPSAKDRDADPLQFGYWIQDLIMKAEHAAKRGDHADAAKFWSALEVAVPDRAVAFGKACEEYEALGDHDHAIDSCGQALLRDGLTVQDYTRFIQVVLEKPGPVSPKETTALAQVLDHMKADDTARPVADELECQVGTRTSNVKQLQECTAALAKTAPDSPQLVSYRWALAVLQNKFTDARKLIDQAKAKGVQPAGIESMERMTKEGSHHYWTRVFLLVGAFVLVLVGAVLGGRTLRNGRRRDPQTA